PTRRNDFTMELGAPISLLFGELVRVTFRPYLQIYTDRNCPSLQDIKDDDAENGRQSATGMPVPGSGPLYQDEELTCKANDRATGYKIPTQTVFKKFGQTDPRARFNGARLMLQAVAEFAVSERLNLIVLIEGDPVGERQSYTSKFSAAYGDHDSQFYFQLGFTFKF